MDATVIIANEKYNTDPNWISTSSTYFASNIGKNGSYIPNVFIAENGNSNNTGYSFNNLGNDPTGRSYANDLLGNLRLTNDIGAFGILLKQNNTQNSTSELKIYLEACYTNNTMKTLLNNASYIPPKQPYNISPWLLDDNVSTITNQNYYVDWLLIELRDSENNTKYRKPAILNKEGIVLNSDGTKFSFNNIETDDYYIVVKHRNHLSVMSKEKVSISTNNPIGYDFLFH